MFIIALAAGRISRRRPTSAVDWRQVEVVHARKVEEKEEVKRFAKQQAADQSRWKAEEEAKRAKKAEAIAQLRIDRDAQLAAKAAARARAHPAVPPQISLPARCRPHLVSPSSVPEPCPRICARLCSWCFHALQLLGAARSAAGGTHAGPQCVPIHTHAGWLACSQQ